MLKKKKPPTNHVLYAFNLRFQGRDCGSALALLHEMQSRGATPDFVALKLLLRAFLADSDADQRNAFAAVSVLEVGCKLRLSGQRSLYHEALRLVARRGDWASAAVIVEGMRRSIDPDPNTYALLAGEAAHRGNWEAVLRVIREAREIKGGAVEAWRTAVLKFEMRERFDDASRLAFLFAPELAISLPPRMQRPFFEHLVFTFSRAKRSLLVRKTMTLVRRVGIVPTGRMYALAIQNCGASVSRGKRYLDDMIKRGIPPDSMHLVAALRVCSKASEVPSEAQKGYLYAKVLLSEMRECGVPLTEAVFYEAIVVMGKAGDERWVLDCLQAMADQGTPPTWRCFREAVRAVAMLGRVGTIQELLAAMRMLNVENAAGICPIAVSTLASRGFSSEVLQIFDEMIGRGYWEALSTSESKTDREAASCVFECVLEARRAVREH